MDSYTIYFNPKDAPGKYVARRFVVAAGGVTPTDDHYIDDEIEAVRRWIRDFSARRGSVADVRFDRAPNDEPPILESWL